MGQVLRLDRPAIATSQLMLGPVAETLGRDLAHQPFTGVDPKPRALRILFLVVCDFEDVLGQRVHLSLPSARVLRVKTALICDRPRPNCGLVWHPFIATDCAEAFACLHALADDVGQSLVEVGRPSTLRRYLGAHVLFSGEGSGE